MLTLFFFILFGNFLLGLLPGAGNMTGNIAVTLTIVLALLTFILTNVSGNKAYWGHISSGRPGVPLALTIPSLCPGEKSSVFLPSHFH
jgi:F-type H+-transporting ATPase subunit a